MHRRQLWRVSLLLLCTLLQTVLAATAIRSCQDYPTLAESLASDPELTTANAISIASKATTILSSPLVALTLISPIDSAAIPEVQAAGNLSQVYKDFAAHWGTIYGDYSIENATSVPSINSDLGFVTQTDKYAYKFYKDKAGQLYIQGQPQFPPSKVVGVIEACNGMIYKMESVLDLASGTDEQEFLTRPEVQGITAEVIDDRIIEQYFGSADAYACAPPTLSSRGVPESDDWFNIWGTTGVLDSLRDPSKTYTVFLPPASSMRNTSEDTLYNMLPGLWCPDELVAAESKGSLLGEITGRDLPLRFSNDSEGNLIVSGESGSARVVSKAVWCSSIIYMTDAPLEPAAAANISVAIPAALPTLPLRHINCSAYNYLDAVLPSESSSSSNTGLIVGLSVGICCAALLAAAGIYIAAGRRRRARERAALEKEYAEDIEAYHTNNGADSTLTDYSGGDVNGYGSIPALQAGGWLAGEHYTARLDTSSSPDSIVDNAAIYSVVRASESNTKTGQLMSQLSRLASSSGITDFGLDIWDIDPRDVEISVDKNGGPIKLGTGAFGVTYLGKLRGVQPCAIKVLHADQEAAFLKEVAILKHVNRDINIVQLYGSSKLSDDQLLIIMELAKGGDLRKALDSPDTVETMAWKNKGKQIALEIARGLTALHANNVVHRDLKSKNVLLTETMQAKIADVGIAAIHSQGYLTASAGRVMGTLAWSAPEMLLGSKCSEKVDIYSLGIVLYELVTRQIPRRGLVELPKPSESCPAELISLISDCIKINPKKRPSAKQVCDRIMKIPPITTAEDVVTEI